MVIESSSLAESAFGDIGAAADARTLRGGTGDLGPDKTRLVPGPGTFDLESMALIAALTLNPNPVE